MPTPSELVRDAFLGAAAEARGLITSRAVAANWNEPSALVDMTVGALAGHLARAVFVVVGYLDASDSQLAIDPADATTTADAYFEQVLPGTVGAGGEGIRARAAAEASEGQDALVARFDATIRTLDERFASEPAERALTVATGAGERSATNDDEAACRDERARDGVTGIKMPLDEYLVTRMIELVVHADDLAASVGIETPEFDALTMACVIGCMLAMVRARHGDIAVVRGFARRERDVIDALRAF